MTDPVIRLDSDLVAVEPGGQAQVGVTISNPGSIVEGYALDVVGEGPSSWAQVIPAELSVYPQQEARAIVTFSPPSGTSAPSGTNAFGVRARSTVDPDTSAVAEGDVEIGKVFGLQAKIVPVTSSGRWRGRHVVQISNWGNAPATLRMVASDPDAALGFYVRPDVVELPLGGTATVRMSVKTRKPFLRGSAVRLPFSVVGERADAAAMTTPSAMPAMAYADPSRPVVDGAFNQKPILSAGLVALLGLVAVAVVGLVVYLVAFRPTTADPGLGSAGPPPKPELVVEAKGPNAVLVSWEPIEGVETYNLFTVDPESKLSVEQTPVPAGQNGKLVEELQPETTYCYQLNAVRGGQESPRSDEQCARTDPGPPPTASPSPSGAVTPSGSAGAPSPTTGGGVPPPGGGQSSQPGGSMPPGSNPPPTQGTLAPPGAGPFAGGKWIAVADVAPEGPAGEARVADTAAKLGGITPPAVILHSRDFPTMRDRTGKPLAVAAVLVAVGPFNTVDEANAVCPQVNAATGGSCLLYQPQP